MSRTFILWCSTRPTAPGPSLRTRSESSIQRINLPQATASMKGRTLAIDALEQEEFAAGAAQAVGQEAADGRANRGEKAIEPEVGFVVPDVDGEDGVHGDGDGGGIEEGDGSDAPDAELGKEKGDKLPLGQQTKK